jgi:4-carboxymuconolactone decarboxylase
MKKLISIVKQTFLLAVLLCGGTASAEIQGSETIKTQEDMALTSRQKALSAIAGLEAKGNTQQLYTVLGQALEEGLTVAEAKEALSQLYAYTGFPRSLNALAQLQKVVSDRKAAGKSVPMGQDDATVLPENFNSLKEGTEVQTRLVGAPYDYTFAPRTDYYLKAHLFGDIFAGKALSHADREIVTVSAIASLPGCEPQLRSHCHGALNMGVSREELAAIPDVLEQYVDKAAAARAREAVAFVLNEKVPADKAVHHGIEDSPWPVGEPNVNFAKYFDGNSYLAPMGGGAANVTFEPGCRNHWHIHHKGVQVLVCVAGRGWYQEWGKPAVELRPGMVIAIPAEVKHWHGAAKDSWFQHLAYMTNVQEGASNEWCEAVDSTAYNALK